MLYFSVSWVVEFLSRGWKVSKIFSIQSTLWQYGLWSFLTGVYVKLERFFLQNQHTQRKFLNFENWLIISSSIVYGAKIEISGTKWVRKTPIYIFSTFSSKINQFKWKNWKKIQKLFVAGNYPNISFTLQFFYMKKNNQP